VTITLLEGGVWRNHPFRTTSRVNQRVRSRSGGMPSVQLEFHSNLSRIMGQSQNANEPPGERLPAGGAARDSTT